MTHPPGMTVEAAFALGIDHLETGRHDAALQVFAAILAAAPGHPQATYLVGVALLQSGRPADALPHLTTASGADPGNWRIGLALAGGLDGLGRLPEASAALRRVGAVAPEAAQGLAALSAVLERQGAPPGRPATIVRRALAGGFLPGDPAALFNLARTLLAGGATEPAARLLRCGLALAPAMPELVNALAAIGLETLRISAEGTARRALAIAPSHADYRYNLAGCLALRGATDAAAGAFRQVLALAPSHGPALNNLGLVLKDQCLVELAFTSHRRALAIEPGNADLWRNLLATLLYLPHLDEDRRFAHHLAAGRALQTGAAPLPPAPTADAGRSRLTVAYLSSDFRDHPVGRALEPVIAAHDRRCVRIVLYLQRHRADEVTRRFERLADLVRDVTTLDDAEVARLMRSDGIEVLAVIAGRYDRNRPGVAAHRAAPVQVSLHDPATSGIAEMDYLIADPVLVPRASHERFVERVVRVPHFVVQAALPDLPASRITGRPPTFGSLNAPAKLSTPTLNIWARLLQRVPQSRLVLKSKNLFGSNVLADRILGVFAAHGVGAERIYLRAAVEPLAPHLANYGDIDVALDPFPFNGSTTTFEALWMGVPVVTLSGERMAGRWSASMLRAIGHDDLVASDEARYLDIATRLIRDPGELDRLRSGLRPLLRSSALMDGRGRARQLERVYRALWQRRPTA
ncbi:MAG: tetratricopeptide repeat protein [Alphaproteobacteria bacterium]|nr:tetratricopeptide repeat protein [Alphaproteobacteria bacterium]